MTDDTNNEPVATGWIATQITGDQATAKLYIREARRLMGSMKSINGVNDRIARGEPGGFYRSKKTFLDGTVIDTITNNGVDKILIHSPLREQQLLRPPPTPPTKHEQAQAHIGHEKTTSPVVVNPFQELPVTRVETSEEEEQERYDFSPYLWVGARIVEGGVYASGPNEGEIAVAIHLCVWEPGSASDDPDILSNRVNIDGPQNDSYTEAQYPLRDPENFLPEGDTTGIAYTESKMFQVSKNNPQGIPMHAPDDDQTDWDEMVISDPDDDLGIGLRSDTATGDYFVKAMIRSNECQDITPVTIELRIIVGKGKNTDETTQRFTIEKGTKLLHGFYPKGFFVSAAPPFGYNTVADYGDNPHGPHWVQEMGVASMPHTQAGVDKRSAIYPSALFTTKAEVPPTGFVQGEFPTWQFVCPVQYGIGWGEAGLNGDFEGDNLVSWSVPTGARFKFTGLHSDEAYFAQVDWWFHDPYCFVSCGETDEGAFSSHVDAPISFGTFACTSEGGASYSVPVFGLSSGIVIAPFPGDIPPGFNYFLATAIYSYDDRAFSFYAGLDVGDGIFQALSDAIGRSIISIPFPMDSFPCAVT
jgi:hypothetical protein